MVFRIQPPNESCFVIKAYISAKIRQKINGNPRKPKSIPPPKTFFWLHSTIYIYLYIYKYIKYNVHKKNNRNPQKPKSIPPPKSFFWLRPTIYIYIYIYTYIKWDVARKKFWVGE